MKSGKLNICMLTTVHTALDHRIYTKEAKLLSMEHDVTIIAIARKMEGNKTTTAGINIIGYPGVLGYAHHLANCRNALMTALNHRFDVVHCHEPSSLFLGCVLKLVTGSKLVYDRHEYYPRMIREIIEKRGLNRLGKIIEVVESISEKWMMMYADRVIVVDNVMGNLVKHSAVIHNYPSDIKGNLKTESPNFGYVGTLDHRRIPDTVEIINKLKSSFPSIHYNILGPAYDPSCIPENTDTVEYCGTLPHEKVNGFLESVSFGFCLYDKIERYENARSSKTFEYISAGVPIIASRTKGNQFIEDNGFGILIDPDDIDTAVEQIKAAIPRCAEFSANCLKADYHFEGSKLTELYNSLQSRGEYENLTCREHSRDRDITPRA